MIIFVLGRGTVTNDCWFNIANIAWRNDSTSGMIFQKIKLIINHMLTDASVFSGSLKIIGFDYSWNASMDLSNRLARFESDKDDLVVICLTF